MLVRKFFVVMLLLAACMVPQASRASPLYTAGFLPGIDFAPAGMNNAGQIVGSLSQGPGGYNAIRYDNGVVTNLGTFGGRSSYATAINEAGAITGFIVMASGEQHAYRYQDGSVLDLGAGTAGLGINARGDVVGSIQAANGSTGFLYSDGKLVALGNLGTGTEGSATDINDHGVVAGTSTIAASQAARHPYLYSDGQLQDLGTLAGGPVNSATAINNAGQVAGISQGADGLEHAFLYEGGSMQDISSLGPIEVHVLDLNEHGTLVGTASTLDGVLVPFISLDGALVDLNKLVDPALGWQLQYAYANNDLEQIVSYGCRAAECGLVLLNLASAVPEPGAAWLLLPGLLVLAGARWQQLRRKRSAKRFLPTARRMQTFPGVARTFSLIPR